MGGGTFLGREFVFSLYRNVPGASLSLNGFM